MEIPLIPSPVERSRAGLIPLSRIWEMLGWIFPRQLLTAMEIRGWPAGVEAADPQADLAFWHSRRVALVSQSASGGLYTNLSTSSWRERVLSSGKHFGPFSFFSDLGADYRVVRQGDEPETYFWKGKYSLDPNPAASYERVLNHIQTWECSSNGKNALAVDDVDWSSYDLVVGIDVPIPERIVQRCPRTFWAYYSMEAGGPLQKKSLLRPAAGYHIFLNHGFRRFRCRPRNRPHVLEFPFTFQSRKAWETLTEEAGQANTRREDHVVLDRASPPPSRLGTRLQLRHLEGNSGQNPARAYLHQMLSSRFAIRTDPKTRWGNWAVEAIQAGCLFLGRADSLAMPGILLPALVANTTDEAWARAESLLEKPEEMELLLRLQSILTDYLCFQRPLAELTRLARAFFQR
jgi:hypothetical protein